MRPDAQNRDADGERGGPLALAVDDNPADLKLLEIVLRGAGYRVTLAGDADAALRAIDIEAPTIALFDVQMPGIDGLALTRRLKSDPRTAAMPIVVVTSHALDGDEARARAAGCDGYITKPIDTRALPSVLAELLARTTRSRPKS